MEFIVKIDTAALADMIGAVDPDQLVEDIETAMHDAGFENVLLSVRVKDEA